MLNPDIYIYWVFMENSFESYCNTCRLIYWQYIKLISFLFFFIPALKNGLCCIHFTLTQSLHQKTETNLFYYLNLKRKKITLMSAIQEIKIFQFISDIQVKPIWYNVLLLKKKATEIKIIFLCLVVKAIFMKISLT